MHFILIMSKMEAPIVKDGGFKYGGFKYGGGGLARRGGWVWGEKHKEIKGGVKEKGRV